jgi:hypothetical protein
VRACGGSVAALVVGALQLTFWHGAQVMSAFAL